jgi:hypothetical protein
MSGSCHTRERFAGARACLEAAGSELEKRDRVGIAGRGALADVGPLLDRSDRPEGILAFSVGPAMSVVAAAAERDLVVGRDFEMVSWIAEECYESHYLPIFRGRAAAPAIVWSAATMAEHALALLADVGDGRVKDPVRLLVPTKLRLEG